MMKIDRRKIKRPKKPDIDNLIKSVCDGLNGVAYKDDSQIVKLTSSKIFANRDGIDIYIKELNRDEEENSGKSERKCGEKGR
jgi:Holliday junction resolvase RusA-like endonuclease